MENVLTKAMTASEPSPRGDGASMSRLKPLMFHFLASASALLMSESGLASSAYMVAVSLAAWPQGQRAVGSPVPLKQAGGTQDSAFSQSGDERVGQYSTCGPSA